MLTINHVRRLADDLLIEGRQRLRLCRSEHDGIQIQHAAPILASSLAVSPRALAGVDPSIGESSNIRAASTWVGPNDVVSALTARCGWCSVRGERTWEAESLRAGARSRVLLHLSALSSHRLQPRQ